MGEPRTPYFYDLGISGRGPGSLQQLFLSVETPRYLKNPRTPKSFLKDPYKLRNLGKPNFETLERRTPTNPEDPPNKFLKILDMKSIYIKKHEMHIW